MTNHKAKLFAASVLSLAYGFSAPFALAQSDTSDAAEYVGLTAGGSSQAEDHIQSSGYEVFVPSAQISSNGDQVSLDFSLDYKVAGSRPPSGGQVRGNFLMVSLKGSVPVNSAKANSLVDFKTFGNNGKLTLGFNYFRPSVTSVASEFPVVRASAAYCVNTAIFDWINDNHDSSAGYKDALAARERLNKALEPSSNFGAFEIVDEAAGTDKSTGTVGSAIHAACSQANKKLSNENSFATVFARKALSPAAYNDWRKTNQRGNMTMFLGAEVSLGYNKFSIVDRPSVSQGQVDRIGFDAKGHVGVVLAGTSTLATVNFGFVRSYTAQAVVDVCGPPNLAGTTICVNGQDGPPTRKETGYVGVSVRQVLLRNKYGEPVLGIRPSATYVLKDKDWQFELPFYLQRNESGGLDAGVRVVYNTGMDKVGIGAFVGVPF